MPNNVWQERPSREYREAIRDVHSPWALLALLCDKATTMATTVIKSLEVADWSALQTLAKLVAISGPPERKGNRVFFAPDVSQLLVKDVA